MKKIIFPVADGTVKLSGGDQRLRTSTLIKRLFLSVYVDDVKLAGKKQNINPTWKFLMKDVDLGEPTSFFDHVYLGCTQRQCEISKDIVDKYRSCLNHEFPQEQLKNYHGRKI